MGALFFLSMKLLAMVLVHGQETGFTPSADPEWIDIGTQTVYYIERHKAASWFTAWKNCASKAPGGRLAKFQTMNEMILLRPYLKYIRDFLWIGLRYNDKGPFMWTDNSTSTFSKWEIGEPRVIIPEECVQLYAPTMTWKLGPSCHSDHIYICSADKDVKWIDTGHETAYYIERHLKTTWPEASRICTSLELLGRPGRLANFATKDEMLLLHSHLNDIKEYLWIGIRSYWKDSSSLAWTDDRLLTFTNWETSEPNNPVLKDCVGLNATTMAWNDQLCSSKQRFICAFGNSPKSKLSNDFRSGGPVVRISVSIVISQLILCILVFILG